MHVPLDRDSCCENNGDTKNVIQHLGLIKCKSTPLVGGECQKFRSTLLNSVISKTSSSFQCYNNWALSVATCSIRLYV